ncbi:uncharacterized protein LOC118425403 [Branchiostoma floridae]|uniref:Uncharacterized protein LOC118425403 n=1 Tax=Branchiostoma floridae TaxID=7739 RepID=A0A9J7LXG1_BRAFL|nr:uncharacterized protein LOC118425403 [Branchiostoma floridae]
MCVYWIWATRLCVFTKLCSTPVQIPALPSVYQSYVECNMVDLGYTIPALPSVYQAYVECNMVDLGYTIPALPSVYQACVECNMVDLGYTIPALPSVYQAYVECNMVDLGYTIPALPSVYQAYVECNMVDLGYTIPALPSVYQAYVECNMVDLGYTIPALPSVYQAYVECNMVDLGYTVAVMEYYDGVRNRGSIRSEAHGSTRAVVYDFPHDEAFVVMGSSCQTQKASELSMSQLGLFGVNSGNGTTGHVYSVNQVFHFGPQVSLFYEGTAEVRGIPVMWWSTCQYLSDMDLTFFGQYYFTLPGYQSASYGVDDMRSPVPVRINVTGRTGGFPQRHISHVYEFSQFRANIDPGAAAFETPPHVYCSGREETVPLPPVPAVFSFNSEVVTANSRLIGNFKEWFDTEDRITRYDTKPPPGSDYSSSNPISTVDDFNTGLSYLIDRRTGDCTVSAVRNNSVAADDLPADPFHVRMMTAEEFFHFENTSWAYVGEVDVDGLPCMKWIGLRDDYPPNNPIQTTWEWSFAQPGWTSAMPSATDVTSQSFPVMLEVIGVHRKDFSFSYSFSMFSEVVDISVFDIVSQCFITAQKKRVQIIFPGQFPADLNLNWFRTALKKGVASAAQVESLRVTDIQVSNTGGTYR